MDTFEALRTSYLTDGLSDEDVRLIASISAVEDYEDMADVIREFDRAGDVFILIEGKARVTTNTGEPIARLREGSIVGEVGLFSDEPRTASVVSDGPSRFVRLNGDKLKTLMDDNPGIGVKVMRNVGRTLVEHLRSSNIHLESVLRTL